MPRLSVPFDPLIGTLVNYLHDLIQSRSTDALTRGAIMELLLRAPLLCKSSHVECQLHPNRAWLVTFEVHVHASFVHKIKNSAHYLDYIHPRVDVDASSTNDHGEQLSDPSMLFSSKIDMLNVLIQLYTSDRLRDVFSAFSDAAGGGAVGAPVAFLRYNHPRRERRGTQNYVTTFTDANMHVMRHRVVFACFFTYFTSTPSPPLALFGNPELYTTAVGMPIAPLPDPVVSFVAFLRFQHATLKRFTSTPVCAELKLKCDLGSCTRPLRPEYRPFGYPADDLEMMQSGLESCMIPPGAPNSDYWSHLRTHIVAHHSPESRDVYQAYLDEFEFDVVPEEDKPVRPFAHVGCYTFCCRRCQIEFYKDFEDKILFLRCAELEPQLPATRPTTNGHRRLSIHKLYLACLKRNEVVARRMRASRSQDGSNQFKVDMQAEMKYTIDMLNIDTGIVFVASVVCELPATVRKARWLPTTENWRSVELVRHQTAVKVKQIYMRHNVEHLLTQPGESPKWVRALKDAALSIL